MNAKHDGPAEKAALENISEDEEQLLDGLLHATKVCFGAAHKAGWWNDLNTGESLIGKRNHGELFILMVSEITEAMEAHRKGKADDKLPHRDGVEVELADTLIRIFDYAGAHGLDLAGAVVEKMRYNASRADHKPENRRAAGGKAY